MPRSEEANRQIRDERRRQILHAAAVVFARKGLALTRISDIAEASGISQGLIYRYFSSKEELFKALVETALDRSQTGLQQLREQAGTPWEKLSRLTAYMWEGMRRQPAYVHVVLHALIGETVPEEIRGLVQYHVRESQAFFRELIVEGQRAGQVVAGDPDELTLLYGSLMLGLASGAWFINSSVTQPSVEGILRILKG
ncbi:TetR/AcrR family transcriptional regulator [Thermogemmatispora sp.]|uniref:TetR/AcrR family transcriptional regulator n=1 Tax=Thermogemmatispora sp. TaxID=1968838 RepID=UPI0035E44190